MMRNLPLLFALLLVAPEAHGAVVSYRATGYITYIVDPAGKFPDVRLGDPFTGIVQYDPAWPIVDEGYAWSGYMAEPPFVGATFETGGLSFVSDATAQGITFAGNDRDDFLVDLRGDSAILQQPAIPPAGFAFDAPMLAWSFRDPGFVALDSPTLPSELHLEDWPLAEMGFLDWNLEFEMEISGTIETLERVYFLGDTNGDLFVDLIDLNNVRNNFGSVGDGIPGDTNGDFAVDLEDLNYVRDHFGELLADLGSSDGGRAVPEPNSSVLLVIALPLFGIVARSLIAPARIPSEYT